MSAELERDLGAWASGALSRERLLAAHGAEAAGSIALHERMVELVAGTPIPDAEAGWAALLSKIGAPAPVVPLRRHDPRRRTVSLLVAAALVLAGSAYAAVRTWTREQPAPRPAATRVAPVGTTFGPSDRGLVPPPAPTAPARRAPGSPDPHRGGGPGVGGEGSSGGGDGGSPSMDDPNDRDHGPGNDGSHDDQGGGNDGPSGSRPDGSGGSGGQQEGSNGQGDQTGNQQEGSNAQGP